MKTSLGKGLLLAPVTLKTVLFNQFLEPGDKINVPFYSSNITSVQGTNHFFRQSHKPTSSLPLPTEDEMVRGIKQLSPPCQNPTEGNSTPAPSFIF